MNEISRLEPAPETLIAKYGDVSRAKSDLEHARRRLEGAEKAARSRTMALRKALPVSQQSPCCVAVLPDGMLAVHVWTDDTMPHGFYLVPASFFDHDGKARSQFRGEHLGQPPERCPQEAPSDG